MICSNCKNVYENLSFCPLCKTPYDFEKKKNTLSKIDIYDEVEKEVGNISIAKKFKKVDEDKLHFMVNYYSKKYFNKSLDASLKNRISEAIEYAKISIYFDANNKDARNLLGLCYLETGRVGEASYEFLLSCFIDDNEYNLAHTYISIIERNVLESEKYDLSIEHYNQALQYAKQRSTKQAISELENAIKYNEKFVDAYLLLALCNLHLKNYKEVVKFSEKVLKIDIDNPFALKYISECKVSIKEPHIKEEKKEKQVKEAPYLYGSDFSNNSKQKNKVARGWLVGALIGCLITAVLIYTLDTFFNVDSKRYEMVKLENEGLVEKLETSKKKYEEDFNALQKEYKAMLEEKKQLEANAEVETAKSSLDTAVMYFNTGDNIKAANSLKDAYDAHYAAINNSIGVVLSTSDLEVYKDLASKTFEEAAIYYFEEGTVAFEAGEFEKALVGFEKSVFFYQGLENQVKAVDSFYWLARSYESTGNKDKAVELYNYILETYPEYALNSEIKNRVQTLGEP